jgi:hypothetical protein
MQPKLRGGEIDETEGSGTLMIEFALRVTIISFTIRGLTDKYALLAEYPDRTLISTLWSLIFCQEFIPLATDRAQGAVS